MFLLPVQHHRDLPLVVHDLPGRDLLLEAQGGQRLTDYLGYRGDDLADDILASRGPDLAATQNYEDCVLRQSLEIFSVLNLGPVSLQDHSDQLSGTNTELISTFPQELVVCSHHQGLTDIPGCVPHFDRASSTTVGVTGALARSPVLNINRSVLCYVWLSGH